MKCKNCSHYMVMEISIPAKNKPELKQKCLISNDEIKNNVTACNKHNESIDEAKEI